MKAGDIVSHEDYGVGRVRDLRRAGREANVEFHIGVLVVCETSELRLLGAGTAGADRPEDPAPPAPLGGARPAQSDPFGQLGSAAAALVNVGQLQTPPAPPVPVRPLEGDVRGESAAPARPHVPAPAAVQPHTPAFEQGTAQTRRRDGPAPDEQFQSRQVIEALRLGVVPRFKIDELTIGLRSERATVEEAFERTEKYGGDACAIVGEYGTGKSHFFEWTAQQALNRGYLVATASLDLRETPPSKPFRIYNALVTSLRYPDRHDGGNLGGLFERVQERLGVDALRRSLTAFHDFWDRCPLYDAFRSFVRFRRESNEERVDLILRWISGDKLPVWALRNAKIFTADTLRSFTTVADQYCYLLSGIAWYARQAGYRGLVALVDESEHYSLLTTAMRERADVLFQGLIYSALGSRQSRIPVCPTPYHGSHCGLRHGGNQPYPFAYAPESGLLFMFAATTSAVALDYDSWLDQDKIIRLEGRLTEGEIEELLARIYVHHRKAFSYDRKADFADASAELISLYESGRFNLRELIRVSTEAYDLIYRYPGYSPRLED